MKKEKKVSPEKVAKIIEVTKAIQVAMVRNGGYVNSKIMGAICEAHRIGNGIESYMVRYGIMVRPGWNTYRFVMHLERINFEEFAQYLYVTRKEYNERNEAKKKAQGKQLACKFDSIHYTLNKEQIDRVAEAIITNQPSCSIIIQDIHEYIN